MSTFSTNLLALKQKQMDAFDQKDWESLKDVTIQIQSLIAQVQNSQENLAPQDYDKLKDIQLLNQSFTDQALQHRQTLIKEILSFKKHKSAVKAYRDES